MATYKLGAKFPGPVHLV